jgi:uncharacterized cofD-like protein
MRKRRPKIVVIGGGTGTYQVLVGLKKYPVDLTAVVATSDSGGSSGRLRQDLGILPPGDIRRALVALSNLPISKKTLAELFEFRFNNGEGIAGHSVGNLLLAALTQITGRPDLAIAEAERIMDVSGHVLPVTIDDIHLHGVLKDGTVVHGETDIDVRRIRPEVPLQEVFLSPEGKVFSKTREAILKADLIILGPGDLFTSIVPNLLVKGVNRAIKNSKGKLVFVVGLMTKHGETDGYQVSDFVREIKKYLGPASERLETIIVNKGLKLPLSTSRWYTKYKSKPVRLNGKIERVKIISRPLVNGGKLIRHHPEKLAKVLVNLLEKSYTSFK